LNRRSFGKSPVTLPFNPIRIEMDKKQKENMKG
jgi:hypothetical protein